MDFSNPDALFEEFEKEPVSRFDSSAADGDEAEWNNQGGGGGGGGGGGDPSRLAPPVYNLLFRTPKELAEEPPGIQLTFLNHPKLMKHRSAIEAYVGRLLNEDDGVNGVDGGGGKGGGNRGDDGICSQPQPLPTSVDLAPPGCGRRFLSESSPWRTTGCLQLYPRFILDAHGHPLVALTHELTIGWEIPPFDRLFEKYIPQEEEEGLVPKGTRRGRVCFNCGEENHAIADCPLPKNMKEIQRRKAEVRKANNVPTLSGNKATLDVSVDPRFKHAKPGVISDDLRSAIGCGDRKLPPWIYRMRGLGYPPGWLEEAKLTYSGLTMHEGDGGRLRSDGLRFESGEVEDLNFEEAKEFQLAKLVAFPGFNAPPPDGFQDETRRYSVGPYSRNQSLDLMRSDFSRRNEDLKRRLGVSTDESSEDEAPPGTKRRKTLDRHEEEEMELSSSEGEHRFRPPLPPGTPPPPTPPAPLPTTTPPRTPGSSFGGSTPSSSRRGGGGRLPSDSSGPRSSCSSQSDGEDLGGFAEGFVVVDELEDGEVSLEDGEMPPTPPPPAPETNHDVVAEISTYEVPPPSGLPRPCSPSRGALPPSVIPTTPANASAASFAIPSTPKSPSASLNSISMEHSTPVPNRFDISALLDDDDDDDDGDDDAGEKDDAGAEDDLDASQEDDAVAAGSGSTPSSSARSKFRESNPCVNPVMPTPDQWAKNVSEHIDFENLPNTEGRYSKIKEIAERRKKLK